MEANLYNYNGYLCTCTAVKFYLKKKIKKFWEISTVNKKYLLWSYIYFNCKIKFNVNIYYASYMRLFLTSEVSKECHFPSTGESYVHIINIKKLCLKKYV